MSEWVSCVRRQGAAATEPRERSGEVGGPASARLRQGSGEVSPKRFARRRKRVGESEGRSPSVKIEAELR
jgi:hypothetical protein